MGLQQRTATNSNEQQRTPTLGQQFEMIFLGLRGEAESNKQGLVEAIQAPAAEHSQAIRPSIMKCLRADDHQQITSMADN